MVNNQTTNGIEAIASDITDAVINLEKELNDYFLPLKERNVIVLEPKVFLADAYINLFGSGKSYSNFCTFTNDVYTGEVYDGLNENSPIVLITAVRLPIDVSGKFSKKVYEQNEGILASNQVRQGIFGFPKDVPILFYSDHINKEQKNEINKLSGVRTYIQNPLQKKYPTEKDISNVLNNAAHEMLETKYRNLLEASNSLQNIFLKYQESKKL